MSLIDSHSHLQMPDFNKDRDGMLERAFDGGLSRIITIGIDVESSIKGLKLAQKYDCIYATIGYHPHNAETKNPPGLKELCLLASEPKIIAWGEIGLDFFKRYSPPENQIAIFKQQLDMAEDFDLPLIIHDREAHDAVLDILKKRGKDAYKGVIHCFSGDYKLAMAFIEMGFYISFPGTVTYKNAHLVRDAALKIPMDRMLIETDSPFLAPVPERGKRNEPLFITYTAREIARLRNINFEEVAKKTSENAIKLFNLNKMGSEKADLSLRNPDKP